MVSSPRVLHGTNLGAHVEHEHARLCAIYTQSFEVLTRERPQYPTALFTLYVQVDFQLGDVYWYCIEGRVGRRTLMAD